MEPVSSACPQAWGSCGCWASCRMERGARPRWEPQAPQVSSAPSRKTRAGGRGVQRGGAAGVGAGRGPAATVCRVAGSLQLCPGRKGHLLEARSAILERQGKETPRSDTKRRTSRIQSPGGRDGRDHRKLVALCACCPQLSSAGVNEMTSDHAGGVLLVSLPGVPAAL